MKYLSLREDLGSGPRAHLKLDAIACTYNPSAARMNCEVETEGALDVSLAQGVVNKVEGEDRHLRLPSDLHRCDVARMRTHTHTHTAVLSHICEKERFKTKEFRFFNHPF